MLVIITRQIPLDCNHGSQMIDEMMKSNEYEYTVMTQYLCVMSVLASL